MAIWYLTSNRLSAVNQTHLNTDIAMQTLVYGVPLTGKDPLCATTFTIWLGSTKEPVTISIASKCLDVVRWPLRTDTRNVNLS